MSSSSGLHFSNYISPATASLIMDLIDPYYQKALRFGDDIEKILPLFPDETDIKQRGQEIIQEVKEIRNTENDTVDYILHEKKDTRGVLFRYYSQDKDKIKSPAVYYGYSILITLLIKLLIDRVKSWIYNSDMPKKQFSILAIGQALRANDTLRHLFLTTYIRHFKERLVQEKEYDVEAKKEIRLLLKDQLQSIQGHDTESTELTGSFLNIQKRVEEAKKFKCKIIRLDCESMSYKDRSLLVQLQKLEFEQQQHFVAYLTLNNSACKNNYLYFVAYQPGPEQLCGVIQTRVYPDERYISINYLTSRAATDEGKSKSFKYTGSRLLDSVVIEARKRGDIEFLSLYPASTAVPFYLKYGFYPVDSQLIYTITGTPFVLSKARDAYQKQDWSQLYKYTQEIVSYKDNYLITFFLNSCLYGISNSWNPMILLLFESYKTIDVNWYLLLKELLLTNQEKEVKQVSSYLLSENKSLYYLRYSIDIHQLTPEMQKEYINILSSLYKEKDESSLDYEHPFRIEWRNYILKVQLCPELYTNEEKQEALRIHSLINYNITPRVEDLEYFLNNDNANTHYLENRQCRQKIIKFVLNSIQKYDITPSYTLLLLSIKLGDFNLVKWIAKQNPSIVQTYLVNEASQRGQYQIAQYLLRVLENREKGSSWWGNFKSLFD